MRIAITGASGLIGTAVTRQLAAAGHQVTRLVRSKDAASRPDAVYWNPADGDIDAAGLAGHDAIVNLAGENIFGLWTRAKKQRMRRSRIGGTRLLADTLARMPDVQRPGLLINASATGYYGNRPPDEPITEDAPPADRFMANLVREWEASTTPAREAGVRVVVLRFAPVIDTDGIPLQAMTLATRLGVGATLGSGRQAFPWVTREEIASVVSFALDRPELQGPINVAAPDNVTHREFADTLARVLNRPRFLKIPAPLIRLLGDLGDELLVGAWVVPARLEAAGYEWRDPTLESALRRMLTR